MGRTGEGHHHTHGPLKVGDLCVVHIPPHMTDLHTKYVGLWERPESGLLCGKLRPGDLALIVDQHDIITDDMRMAQVITHTGQVGWINFLSLRSP